MQGSSDRPFFVAVTQGSSEQECSAFQRSGRDPGLDRVAIFYESDCKCFFDVGLRL